MNMSELAVNLPRSLSSGLIILLAGVLGACATPPAPLDYTAFKQDRPATLLVLPPINESKDVKATSGVLSTSVLPLAEAGYYVLPVSLVDETFKQNGLQTPNDIHDVPTQKLREIFGADAAVYIRVKQYGTTYMIFGSETRVTVEGKIIDLRSGRQLWSGSATSSSQESDAGNQGGLVGLLVKAVITQIIGTVTDASFGYAAISNQRMLGVPRANGLLAGPRSPNFRKD